MVWLQYWRVWRTFIPISSTFTLNELVVPVRFPSMVQIDLFGKLIRIGQSSNNSLKKLRKICKCWYKVRDFLTSSLKINPYDLIFHQNQSIKNLSIKQITSTRFAHANAFIILNLSCNLNIPMKSVTFFWIFLSFSFHDNENWYTISNKSSTKAIFL